MTARSITQLDEATIAAIAAGEVITRPARVVSELVDNALDAGATRIEIAVDGDGTDRIRVTDDGSGMHRADAVASVERHATSKLDSHGELSAVETLGFRGEGLASIADCARLELLTAPADGVGTRVVADGSAVDCTDAGRARGTTVTVRDLFGSRPARRDALSGSATEFGRISDRVADYALAHPSVQFVLVHDGARTFATTGGDRRDALFGVYDRDVARRSSMIHHETTIDHRGDSRPLSIDGVLAYPSVTRATRDHVRVAVNGRPVTSPTLSRSVRRGYGSLLPSDREPIAAVSLSLPPALVDANVHPAKRRVALVAAEAIEAAVETAVSEALSTADARRAADVATDLETKLAPKEGRSPFADATVIGQFRDLYVLCEDDADLLVVDQHAAHERVNYERLRAAVAEEAIPTAPLDPPETVSLSPGLAAAVDAHADALAALGFAVESFGGTTVRVREVPAPFGRVADADALVDALSVLAAGDRPDDLRDALLADLACHPSLKAGDRLDRDDARSLLDRLGECDRPFSCPHGRPTVVSVDEATLARGFDRGQTRFDRGQTRFDRP
ncbi:DNA mismatch repair endonuclease MutL [Haloferacaceae archaeon DSL9]